MWNAWTEHTQFPLEGYKLTFRVKNRTNLYVLFTSRVQRKYKCQWTGSGPDNNTSVTQNKLWSEQFSTPTSWAWTVRQAAPAPECLFWVKQILLCQDGLKLKFLFYQKVLYLTARRPTNNHQIINKQLGMKMTNLQKNNNNKKEINKQ